MTQDEKDIENSYQSIIKNLEIAILALNSFKNLAVVIAEEKKNEQNIKREGQHNGKEREAC